MHAATSLRLQKAKEIQIYLPMAAVVMVVVVVMAVMAAAAAAAGRRRQGPPGSEVRLEFLRDGLERRRVVLRRTFRFAPPPPG